ncbi:hypothetical protein J9A53_16545 [Klebsiella pneumoniae]
MTNEIFTTIISRLNFSLRHKTPVILQSEATECGIACLAMVCGHGNDSNLLIVFYVQIMPDDLVMQLHRF